MQKNIQKNLAMPGARDSAVSQIFTVGTTIRRMSHHWLQAELLRERTGADVPGVDGAIDNYAALYYCLDKWFVVLPQQV